MTPPTVWAEAARVCQAKYPDAEIQKAIDILQSLLLGEQAPDDAATAIATLYKARIKLSSNGYNSGVVVFWAIFSGCTREFGAAEKQAGRLVDLLIAIANLPDVLDESGSSLKNQNDAVYWKGLPDFPITFREYGINIDFPDDHMEETGKWLAQRAPLLNATTFAATLLARANFKTYMEFHAATAFSDGIETPYDTPERYAEAPVYVPAAATWILLAGRKLRELCLSGFDSFGGFQFSLERWEDWKQKFGSIKSMSEIDQGSRESAAKAASKMEAIEKSEVETSTS